MSTNGPDPEPPDRPEDQQQPDKPTEQSLDQPGRQPSAKSEQAEGETAEATEAEVEAGDRRDANFLVVGVGASAGGLEAFSELLKHLPADTGMAFVFVQHLDPTHGSQLSEILPRSTRMSVHEATDGMPLEPDHLYVIPPDRDLAVLHGVLHLMSRPQAPARHMPVDYLLRSLAEDQGRRAIGVILSGTGSDGASGVKAIKAEGGITIAQDEESARYSGMPHAAAATGQVDLVLRPAEIADEPVRIARHPQIVRPARKDREEPPPDTLEAMQKVFILLRRATGVDFSQYKQSTVERRISRRMILHKVDSIEQYVQYLQRNPSEINALFDDMLISVTGFFRDPETFDVLKERVFPQIVREKNVDTPVRVWVPACSTGEEAYSIAMVLLEYLSEQKRRSRCRYSPPISARR
jgi:two-component system CheB/CheR fusion protein